MNLTPAEREQAVGQLRGALRGVLDHLERAVRIVVLRLRLADHLDAAEDRGDQVVEVVRDAAGEPADRLEPARAMQPLLRGPRSRARRAGAR